MKRIFYLLSILLLISCGNSKNSPEFIEAAEGRYLFNSDETLDVFFVDGKMNVKCVVRKWSLSKPVRTLFI